MSGSCPGGLSKAVNDYIHEIFIRRFSYAESSAEVWGSLVEQDNHGPCPQVPAGSPDLEKKNGSHLELGPVVSPPRRKTPPSVLPTGFVTHPWSLSSPRAGLVPRFLDVSSEHVAQPLTQLPL